MSLKRSDLVTALSEKIATDLFLTMLNPKSRSAKFRFSAFAIEGDGCNDSSASTCQARRRPRSWKLLAVSLAERGSA